jgi:excisionase family DNA binding protein
MTTLTVDFEKAEEMTGVSRFTLRKYVKTGRLKVVRVGRRVVIPISELERMFAPGRSFLTQSHRFPRGGTCSLIHANSRSLCRCRTCSRSLALACRSRATAMPADLRLEHKRAA